MNARFHRPPRARLTACLALSGLGLVAGCSVAPPGATVDSAAIGPVRHDSGTRNFGPFPVPAEWMGQGSAMYKAVVKAKVGATPREFRVTAKSSMVFWLNCIGTGSARLTSPSIGLNWGIPCGDGANPEAVTLRAPHAARGKPIKVLVTASAGARWEVRIDEVHA